MLKIAFAILFALVFVSPTFAQQPQPPASPPPDPQVQVLEAQLGELRQANSQMQNTVWAALALVATLAFGLVLYNGWVVGRNYDRDKAAIKLALLRDLRDINSKDIELSVEKAKLELETEISKSFINLIDGLVRADQGLTSTMNGLLNIEKDRKTKEGAYDIAFHLCNMTMGFEIYLLKENSKEIRTNELHEELAAARIILEHGYCPDTEKIRKFVEYLDQLPAGFDLERQHLRDLLSATLKQAEQKQNGAVTDSIVAT